MMLLVKCPEGRQLRFQVTPNTWCGKIFSSACQQWSVNIGDVTFLAGGVRLRQLDIVSKVLENGDTIDMRFYQQGD